ncbi:MAG TPA: hypothetical protein VGE63_00495 [Candidatus Paceibacterota bacterium]
MNQKFITGVCTIVGSGIGSAIPLIWGASMLSMSSMVFGALGAIAGIWVGFKINNY